MKTIITVLVLSSMLAGCAGNWQEYAAERRDRERAAEAALTPDQRTYRTAMEHGCSSGDLASGNYVKQHIKNVDLYIKDPYYKAGWDDGFAKCKAQGEQINGVIRDSVR